MAASAVGNTASWKRTVFSASSPLAWFPSIITNDLITGSTKFLRISVSATVDIYQASMSRFQSLLSLSPPTSADSCTASLSSFPGCNAAILAPGQPSHCQVPPPVPCALQWPTSTTAAEPLKSEWLHSWRAESATPCWYPPGWSGCQDWLHGFLDQRQLLNMSLHSIIRGKMLATS